MEVKTYRWVFRINDRPFYYRGNLISEDEEFYKINDYKIGTVEVKKDKLIARRPIEDE